MERETIQIPVLGFVKDATAFPMFFVGILIVLFASNMNDYRPTMIGILIIAIFIDGSFTLKPTLHCTPVGLNEETFYLISIYLLGAVFVFGALFYHLFILPHGISMCI